MKNYNMFDVVELNNGNKATIITNDKSSIKVEEVNNNGVSLGIKEIREKKIDVYIHPDEAIELGIIDEIIY